MLLNLRDPYPTHTPLPYPSSLRVTTLSEIGKAIIPLPFFKACVKLRIFKDTGTTSLFCV